MRTIGCFCLFFAVGCFAALIVKAPAQAAAGQAKPGAQAVEAPFRKRHSLRAVLGSGKGGATGGGAGLGVEGDS